MNYQFIYRRLGKETSKIRKQKKISQENLAFDAHIDRSSLAEIEEGKGNPTLKTLLKISRLLKIKLSHLLILIKI
jgi:transcriptional regulator with XRE-family HTH domain